MCGGLIERISARPLVYDLIQFAAGAGVVRRRMGDAIRRSGLSPKPSRVLDVGGGTGGWRGLWPPDARYVCLDLDPLKLGRLRTRHPGAVAVRADATRIPMPDGSADAVAFTFLAHHLDDRQLDAALGESARVLKPGGLFAFVDPVWSPRRLPGRILWRYDRGRHPRDAATLRSAIARHFDVRAWERFAVFHAYAMCIGTPRY